MTAPIDRGLDVAWRIAAGAVLGLVVGILAAVALPGCNDSLWPDPPPVKPPEGACQAAERRLVELGCAEAPGFAGLCERSAARAVDLHPVCIQRITSCTDVDAASRGDRC